MKNIIVIIIAMLLAKQLPAAGDSGLRAPYYIQEAAGAFQLSPALLIALCTTESQCKAKAVNRHDSIIQPNGKRKYDPSYGLFQMKYETAKGLGYQGPAKGLLDPEINAFYAAKLFRKNLDKYHRTVKAISAHNAGKAIHSNKEYVHTVLSHYAELNLDRGMK